MSNPATAAALTAIETLPPAGERRFWYARHNPTSETKPIVLELRERSSMTGPIRLGFSRLIGKRSTVADPERLVEVAGEILAMAGRVDEFVGVLNAKDGDI